VNHARAHPPAPCPEINTTSGRSGWGTLNSDRWELPRLAELAGGSVSRCPGPRAPHTSSSSAENPGHLSDLTQLGRAQ
jgi:hypothetical protein